MFSLGIQGNEAADRLAKEAILRARPRGSVVPFPDLKPKIKKHVQGQWKRSWTDQVDNKLAQRN